MLILFGVCCCFLLLLGFFVFIVVFIVVFIGFFFSDVVFKFIVFVFVCLLWFSLVVVSSSIVVVVVVFSHLFVACCWWFGCCCLFTRVGLVGVLSTGWLFGWGFGRSVGLNLNWIVVCLRLGLVLFVSCLGWFLRGGLVLGWLRVVVVWLLWFGLVWFVSNLLFSVASPAPVVEISVSLAAFVSFLTNFFFSLSDSSGLNDDGDLLLLVLRGIPGDGVLLASLLAAVR